MATCPAGHTSASTDYCDICGSPMGAPTPDAPPTGGSQVQPEQKTPEQKTPGQKTMGVVCPNCGVMNAPGALFCEACGYDYTTGTMPQRPEPLSILDLDTPLPDPGGPTSPTWGDTGSSSDMELSSQAGSSVVGAHGQEDTPGPSGTTPGAAASMLDIDAPHPPLDLSPAPAAHPGPPASAAEPESDTFEWVVEVWLDPEWYAAQQSPDPMPSPGLPDVMPLRKKSLLIGRPSRSRSIHPDIDCEPDTGISRRQAELSTDGTRWFIEDLGSANGTYVAEAAGGLPTDPIPSGRRRELDGDERIYMGAWTRLVLRRATPEEQEAYSSV